MYHKLEIKLIEEQKLILLSKYENFYNFLTDNKKNIFVLYIKCKILVQKILSDLLKNDYLTAKIFHQVILF